MQCAVFTFRIRTGTGVQTVSGVVDQGGTPFTPEYLLFINGSSELNVLWSNATGLLNTCTYNINVYRASDGAGGYFAIGDLPQFGAKICSGGGGSGPNAAVDSLEADAFFGGNIYRQCRINSVNAGQFELEVIATTPWAFTTDVMCVALANGGDLLMEDIALLGNTGVKVLGYEAKAILNTLAVLTTTPSMAAAAGGSPFGLGWDSPNGGAFSSAAYIQYNPVGGNYRYQRNGTWNGSFTDALTLTGGSYVSAWDPTSITMAALYGTPTSSGYVISGAGVVSSSGTETQPLTTGQQVIDTRIDAKWVMLVARGAPAGTTILSDWAEYAVGWTNGTGQTCFWVGESASVLPLKGANIVTDDRVLQFVDATGPNGAATAFGSVASLVSLINGRLTIDWTAVDGVARAFDWFALGTAGVPPTPGLLLTQLPIEAAYGYTMLGPVQLASGQAWSTPAPTPSRRGR